MTYEELQSLLDKASQANNKGNLDEAELLANEVLSELNLLPSSTQPLLVREKFSDFLPSVIERSREDVLLHSGALLLLAHTKYRRGNFDKSLDLAQQSLDLVEENNIHEVQSKAWNFLGNVYNSHGSYDKALEYYTKALTAHEELGEKSGVAVVTGNIGKVYRNLGSYDKALEYYTKALATNEKLGEKLGVAIVTGNIGNVYAELGSYDKALEYYTKALASREELGEKSGVAIITGNIGNVYTSLGSYDKALEYFTKALSTHLELGEKSSIAIVTGNIGNVYYSLGSYSKALEYYFKALTIHEEFVEKSGLARVTGNIGRVYANNKNEGYDPIKGEEFLLKAVTLSTEIGYKQAMVEFHKSLAELYENEKRDAEALNHFKKYIEIRDEVQIEEVKKQAEMREREKEIELAKTAAAAKLDTTTALLHKVLPESIASRMIAGEEKISDYFPAISILFADMVGFTALATEVPPDIVIDLLNHVFDTFDTIMKRNGCEKVKTMGDGYMAVCGAPIPCNDHAERIARAALEMQNEIQLPEEIRSYLPEGTKFGIRIGIHTGAVVCGVIGKERFVWDVYSDAVNIASRMESNGEAYKIHVSKDFAWLLRGRQRLSKGEEEFHLVERGEMDIKGKGMMKTYFLEQSK